MDQFIHSLRLTRKLPGLCKWNQVLRGPASFHVRLELEPQQKNVFCLVSGKQRELQKKSKKEKGELILGKVRLGEGSQGNRPNTIPALQRPGAPT